VLLAVAMGGAGCSSGPFARGGAGGGSAVWGDGGGGTDDARVVRGADDAGRGAGTAGANNGGGGNGGRLRTQTAAANAHDDLLRHTLAVPTGERQTSTVLVEKLAPREARLNRPYDYRIRVTNLTDAPLAGVVVREKLPENFTINRSEPAGSGEDGWVNYTVGELAPLGSRTIEVTGVPRAEGKLATCIAVDYRPTLCAAADVTNPVLKLTKEGPKETDVCEGIRYRYVVSNTGTGTEKDVTVEDVLPEGVTTEDGKNTVSLRVGDLPQGASKELNVRVRPARTGQFASRAVAKAPGGVEVRSDEVSTLVRQPALDVQLAGPPTEYINKTATYTVTVKNTGDAAARKATVGLDAAGSGQVLTASVQGTVALDGVAAAADDPTAPATAAYRKEGVDLGTLNPGETRVVTVTVRATKEGELPLKATAVATCVAPVTARAKTSILTLPALRLEVVDLDDPIRVGDAVVYRVTVKNQGTGADRNVGLTATLPPELEYVTSAGPTALKADGRTVRFGNLETLAAGDQAVWRIEARATKAGDVRLRVDLKSDSLAQPATETEPTRLY
jgi:uncharacterized repeat protein (TIGR01451 family)